MNIYTASKDELRTLKGVGARLADKIIELRQKGEMAMEDLVLATNIPAETWNEWVNEGLLILAKPPEVQHQHPDLQQIMQQLLEKEKELMVLKHEKQLAEERAKYREELVKKELEHAEQLLKEREQNDVRLSKERTQKDQLLQKEKERLEREKKEQETKWEIERGEEKQRFAELDRKLEALVEKGFPRSSLDRSPGDSEYNEGELQKLKKEMTQKNTETINAIHKAKEEERKKVLANFKDTFKTEKKEVLEDFNAKWAAIEKDELAKNELEYEEKVHQWGEEEGVVFSPPTSKRSEGDPSNDTKLVMGKISKVIPKDGVYRGATATTELYVAGPGDGNVPLFAGNETSGARSKYYTASQERYTGDDKDNTSRKRYAKVMSKRSYVDQDLSSDESNDDEDDNTEIDDDDDNPEKVSWGKGVLETKARTSANSGVPQVKDSKYSAKNLGKAKGKLATQGRKLNVKSTQGTTKATLLHPSEGDQKSSSVTSNTGSSTDMLLILQQQQQEWMEKQAEKQAQLLDKLTLADYIGKVNNKKKKKKSKDDSSSSSSSSESDSTDSDTGSSSSDSGESKKHKKHKFYKDKRLPKGLTFAGDGKMSWESFIFQFERIAKVRKWSKRDKLNCFYDGLTEKALDYARKTKGTKKYEKLKKKMAERFDVKVNPSISRRELTMVKMTSDETLEEFSQRVYFLTMDAYPGAKEGTIQQIAVEVFLRGLTDKEAARTASDKCPKTVSKALKYVKNAITTQRSIFGKSTMSHRQVSFAEIDDDNDTCPVRITEASRSQYHTRSLEEIKKDQKIAELEAKLKAMQSQSSEQGRFRTPPPLTRASTPPRFNQGYNRSNGGTLNNRANSPYRQNSPFRPLNQTQNSPYRSRSPARGNIAQSGIPNSEELKAFETMFQLRWDGTLPK